MKNQLKSIGLEDDIDDLFQSGPSFSMIELLQELDHWKENADRIGLLHKQE